MSNILKMLADEAAARHAREQAVRDATHKRWRLICGELYMMQNQIRREQQHTAGTGTNV